MPLLSNYRTTKIVKTQIMTAHSMSQQIAPSGEGRAALHHTEVHCNIALGMIDKYLVLDDPEPVERFFIYVERIRAYLKHLRVDIEENRHEQRQGHIEGLATELKKLSGIFE